MLDIQLNNVLTILDIEKSDRKKIEVVQLLFGMVEGAICLRIGEPIVPPALHWLTNEVVIKRYQLLGMEHLQSETIDVITNSIKRGNILDEYEDDIQSYIDNVQANLEEGKKVLGKRARML